MPYIRISTTVELSEQKKLALRASALDAAVNLLGKPRHIVLVNIEDRMYMHRGNVDNRCAFIDVRVLGTTKKEACDAFALRLSEDVARIANTDTGCVYLSIS